MKILSQIWGIIQGCLFLHIEECSGPLTEKQKQLVAILEVIRIEELVKGAGWRGRPPKNRKQLARAFVMKAFYNWDETRDLIEELRSTPNLRLLCGYESVRELPSEATFSRAFAEFAASTGGAGAGGGGGTIRESAIGRAYFAGQHRECRSRETGAPVASGSVEGAETSTGTSAAREPNVGRDGGGIAESV